MKKDLNIQALEKDHWRSLDELADTPEFRQFLEQEFPEEMGTPGSDISRRTFLSLMGASFAFAGLASCHRPVEKIVPYVKAPDQGLPGEKLYYATALTQGLSARGVVVESNVGRPTKIEGNRNHSLVRGRSNARMQAEILELYDPDRSDSVVQDGFVSAYGAFTEAYAKIHSEYREKQGEGLALLMPSFASPSLHREFEAFIKTFPRAVTAAWDPVNDENLHSGLELSTGKKLLMLPDLAKAKIILGLDSDFLFNEGEDLSNARGFADGRRVRSTSDSMNRYYAVESSYSVTAANADHRLRLKSSEIPVFLLKLAHILNKKGSGLPLAPMPADVYFTAEQEKFLKVLAEDLEAHIGECLILAGRTQSPEVQALVHAMNGLLGADGRTVQYFEPKDTVFPSTADLKTLAGALEKGSIQTLVLFDSNPAYNAPADLKFSSLLKKAGTVIHYGSRRDESSAYADWHIPAAHSLESWGDARSADGSRLIIQPLIAPLAGGIPALSFLHLLASGKEVSDFDLLKDLWTSLIPGSFEKRWTEFLADGVDERDLYTPAMPKANAGRIRESYAAMLTNRPENNGLELVFLPHSSVYDGRYANNGWMQEVPDPVSKVSWDNPAWISASTADKYSLANGDMVTLRLNGRAVDLPVWIVPGQADGVLTLHLGYGRYYKSRIAEGTGFNVYPLRTGNSLYTAVGAELTKQRTTHSIACTQDHGSMEGRPLIREASLEEYRAKPDFAPAMVKHPELRSMWEEHSYDTGYQWGMVIDLNTCIGCNACTISCQSENNIPVVGREMVEKGREMHWIRLDRYFSGDINDPMVAYQPLGCQHCENAPCEQVCPVAATSHDSEGLNVMTYNRCIGTRYCSNNCPYKVRRFNFYNYTKDLPELMKMAQNPEVTVRFRGVMEKCTFCTQRINTAKIKAKREGRELADGEVQTACQQACPVNAISFGNILDPDAEVTRLKENERNYAMLGEFNLKPRNTYLAKLRNPHPELASGKSAHTEHGHA